ncbi:MAG: sulfur carrier protein ThiS [Oscillospiraceae bacterium]|nr:sulfur carrier protein ThiS [Oscillospiraceae bacterium]
MVKVNGVEMDVSGKTVSELLEAEGYQPAVVAVELNEVILPKAEYGSTVLKDGDIAEVVSFVGGG